MKNTKSNETRHAVRRSAWGAGITLAAILAVSGGNAYAGAFTGGNLVVERLGNGTQTLATTGNSIFFDEYLTNASATKVQSISIPDGNTNVSGPSMIEAGTGATTGSISLTPDGQTLCFPGYAVNQPNGSAITTATASAVPRAIGTLNGSGVYTRVATSTLAFSGSNIRSATGDGEGNYWGGGTASTTTLNAGVYYFGTVSTAGEIESGNLRSAKVFNGALWFTSSSSTPGEDIFTFTGQPTSASTGTAVITFANDDSDYNFVVSPSGTVIYDADDGGFSATGNEYGGISKWVFSGGTWTRAYILLNPGISGSVAGTGCFGLAVNWNTAGGPTLYATTSANTSANTLIAVQDLGSGPGTATLIATAGTKQYFRGVSFVPTNAVGTAAPTVTGIFPAALTVDAGLNADFTVSAIGTAPLTNYWYQIVGSSSNLVSGPPSSTNTLTLPDVGGANAGNYEVVISNASGVGATSAVVSLSVIDPAILEYPDNAGALVDGIAEFSASAAGTGLSYQWYYSDSVGDLMGTVMNTTLLNGTIIAGAMSSTLTITNAQIADFPAGTNFVLVVSGTYNTVTLPPVTFYGVATSVILGFWDFNSTNFNNTTPPPFIGNGTASLVNLPPYVTTVVDPNDGADTSFPEGQNLPNNSWGTSSYPATNATVSLMSNKLAGIQFNVSTVGARDISVTYDSRVSATASDYERLQYTSNGTTWVDYPSSSTFAGHSGTGNGGFLPFSYSLAGFPGVDNNPNFGIRVVTELQSTATYGAGVHGVITTNYVGTANTYGTGGTITYDIVSIDAGEPITNSDTPPTISTNAPQATLDSQPITVDFTVGSADMSASLLTMSAVSLNPPTVAPTFSFGGSGASRTLLITPNGIPDSIDAGPILVTVTDTNGLSAATWFNLTLTTQYLPPTNTLTSLPGTNMLADSTLSIPFTVGSESVTVGTLTYGVFSYNNTVIPAGNITISGQGTIHPTLNITPAVGQLGMAPITVTVYDNDNAGVPKSTTATILVMVRPNTNVVLIDYFNYDDTGSLDQVGEGIWGHLSGIDLQMQVDGNGNGDYVTVDSFNNTENLQAAMLGGPFSDTGASVLYASYIVNMNSGNMPTGNGGYFTIFNDGTGATGDYECGVYAVTNGAASGKYRIGIQNFAGNGGEEFSQLPIFQQDLTPGVPYVVVTKLIVSSGLCTLWINPTNGITSTSISDTVSANTAAATLYNIADFELRESGGEGDTGSPGGVEVSHLKVGLTFDSVYPSLSITSALPNVIVNWSDPTLGIQSATNVSGPWSDITGGLPPFTNNTLTNTLFFRFGH